MTKSKKRYFFRYGGARYSLYACADKEAGMLIEQKKKAIDEMRYRETEGMLLSSWSELAIDTYKTSSEREKNHLKKIVRLYILPNLGDRAIGSITPLECQQLVNDYAGKSKTLIDYVYNTIRFVMHRAYINEMIRRDPTEAMVKPKGTRGTRRALTKQERAAVIAVASRNRRHYCYLLMMLCGCRPSEAYNAKGGDIDGNLLHIRGTKTRLSDRYVPIPEELLTLIKNTPENEYIGLTEEGNKQGSNTDRMWKGFRHYLDIELGAETYRNHVIETKTQGLTPYCLRHEYCTELARKGVDLRIAQQLMGHASIKMTADVYTNLDKMEAAKEAAKIIK